MTDKIRKYLNDAVNIPLSSKEVSSLKKNIEATYNSLSTTIEGNTLTATGAWEYRVLSSYPNPDLADDFYAWVVTVDLDVLVKVERSIFKKKVSKNYSAGLSVMRLVVSKGYRSSH